MCVLISCTSFVTSGNRQCNASWLDCISASHLLNALVLDEMKRDWERCILCACVNNHGHYNGIVRFNDNWNANIQCWPAELNIQTWFRGRFVFLLEQMVNITTLAIPINFSDMQQFLNKKIIRNMVLSILNLVSRFVQLKRITKEEAKWDLMHWCNTILSE